MTRRRLRAVGAMAVAVAFVVVLAADNWRLALLAALAAGAIALTRLRYSVLVAVGLLAVTLVLAQTGHMAGSDKRVLPARTQQHHVR
ncbi:MAG: hypothetical protein QOJ85_4327 [Solirubrobacteraceae bacterium]|jgi:hypothetical protein|nr:hypothetical protein [Solirubrobacteraceae bacterium]MEA2243279.1 hypothetical protein [Solirubrobacteraceae bacterium]